MRLGPRRTYSSSRSEGTRGHRCVCGGMTARPMAWAPPMPHGRESRLRSDEATGAAEPHAVGLGCLPLGRAARPRRKDAILFNSVAGWSSLVARWAHNPKVASSNLAPATKNQPGRQAAKKPVAMRASALVGSSTAAPESFASLARTGVPDARLPDAGGRSSDRRPHAPGPRSSGSMTARSRARVLISSVAGMSA